MHAVGTYVRDLGAPLPRLIENALDWEHLPHVHATDFAALDLIEADDSGWSAEVETSDGGRLSLDLRLDDDRLGWVTTSRRDGVAISRIDSRAEATGPASCRVTVSFFVPAVPDGAASAFADYFSGLYARLYDEDEAMMQARHAALAQGAPLWQQRREVTLSDGITVAIPTACPHLGLPLDTDPDDAGIVTCRWHGYRFDARTGLCVSGQSCRWQTGF